MRVLAEFRSEVELELAEAEEARAAIGAGLPAELRDDYVALPLFEALEKFIDFCPGGMNRITPDDPRRLPLQRPAHRARRAGSGPRERGNDRRRQRVVEAQDRPRHGAGHVQQVIQARQPALRRAPQAGATTRSGGTRSTAPSRPGGHRQAQNALRSDLVPKLNSVTSMMSDSTLRRAVVLALHTGMRIGEVCGLRWCDVDFESGLITVRHSVAYVRTGAPSSRTPRTTT